MKYIDRENHIEHGSFIGQRLTVEVIQFAIVEIEFGSDVETVLRNIGAIKNGLRKMLAEVLQVFARSAAEVQNRRWHKIALATHLRESINLVFGEILAILADEFERPVEHVLVFTCILIEVL